MTPVRLRRAARAHPWRLVAPWYAWPPGSDGRRTRALIQKYDTSDLVNAFLRDPRASLPFGDDDLVQEVAPRLSWRPPPGGARKRWLADHALVRTDLRKIFLDTHKRHYLVVAELHCDQPGFPSAARAGVCEVGLVVRRWRVTFAPGRERELGSVVRTLLAETEAARARAADAGQPVSNADDPAGRLRAARAELAAWIADPRNGAREIEEAWVPAGRDGRPPVDGVGAWLPVDDDVVGAERIHPAYPLVPDPRDAGHPGAGRTIYFAALPTGGSEIDATGAPRFDDTSVYEARLFVRRRRADCPGSGRPGCRGERIDGLPTEPYRLAPHFDLDGTSHRPVTIQMPDLRALAAQAAQPGATKGIRVVYPPESHLEATGMPPVRVGDPGQGVCTIAVPLVTIVAQFLIQLVLPLLMLPFGLFWMLRLRSCPSPAALTGAVVEQLRAQVADEDVAAVLDGARP